MRSPITRCFRPKKMCLLPILRVSLRCVKNLLLRRRIPGDLVYMMHGVTKKTIPHRLMPWSLESNELFALLLRPLAILVFLFYYCRGPILAPNLILHFGLVLRRDPSTDFID